MALREKFPTKSSPGDLALMPLDVPVMMSELVPLGVMLLVVTVIVVVGVVVPETVTDGGTKLAVAPVGKPVTVKLTVPAKPKKLVTVTS
jgi:hypothetical protein